MEGKGWFVIYGILVFIVVYLFIAQQQLRGDVNELSSQVAALKTQSNANPVAPAEAPSPTATPSESDARDNKRKSDLQEIRGALMRYQQEKGNFPDELKALIPAYLPQPLSDPQSPKLTYRYRLEGEGFILTAVLEQKDDPDDAKDADGKADGIYTLTEAS